mmetsp:Transcript_19188/g.29391  ORF Transcript_19188/g.29391 Transcript_19188/m.29391 type:complete len:361 (+) Transcript_19188:10-1092(+)
MTAGYYRKYFLQQFELAFDLKEFYLAIFGFLFFHGCAYVLAIYSQKHNLMTDVMVRVFFFIIQVILMFIFEHKLHLFQMKLLLQVFLNAVFIFFSAQMNPIFTYILLSVLMGPQFRRIYKRYQREIDQALKNDVSLEVYTHQTDKKLHDESQDQDIPLPTTSSKSSLGAEDSVLDTPWFSFFMSIALFSFLIWMREELTPDFFHFVTCMVEEEGHFIWIMYLWLNYKCFLRMDSTSSRFLSDAQRYEERLKIVVRGVIEIVISLLIMWWALSDSYSLFYCLAIYAFAAVRSVYAEQLDLMIWVFCVTYMLQNMLVNLFDFIVFKKALGFYDEMDFQEMFSYKLFQFVLCAIISFVYSQCL